MNNEIEQKVREVKREYYRNYARANPEKKKASQERYWLKKALERMAEEQEEAKIND